jgi:AcrR family transcriptional regulator
MRPGPWLPPVSSKVINNTTTARAMIPDTFTQRGVPAVGPRSELVASLLGVVPRLWDETIEAHRRAVRDATLDTTAALVAEHGLASVTMSQIAEQTGIGRATLYKYYPDVEAILVAWQGKELLRSVLAAADLAAARAALDRFYRSCDGVQIVELSRLARTVRLATEILAWHQTTGCSNGPTEAINLLIKKVKRVGDGFRNFDNYRLRLLLHCGVRWKTHRTARLRGRSSRLMA